MVDETEITPEVETYYRHRLTDFPSIDSWVLVQPSSQAPPILTSQVTIGVTKHDIKKSCLDRMNKLIPGTEK